VIYNSSKKNKTGIHSIVFQINKPSTTARHKMNMKGLDKVEKIIDKINIHYEISHAHKTMAFACMLYV